MTEETKEVNDKPAEDIDVAGKKEEKKPQATEAKKKFEKMASEASESSAMSFKELSTEKWVEFCDWVDGKGEVGSLIATNVLRRVGVDAPVMLTFVCIITLIHALDYLTMHSLAYLFAVPHYSSLFNPLTFLNPLTYTRLITHALVHSNFSHLKANSISLLLVGPNVEHSFGSQEVCIILSIVAVTSALTHMLISGTHARQLGASAICFSMILLNSLVSASTGTVPLSFIIISILWIADEVVRLFFASDGVSHHAHLVGAFSGTAYGYMLHREKVHKRVSRIAAKWLETHRSKAKKA